MNFDFTSFSRFYLKLKIHQSLIDLPQAKNIIFVLTMERQLVTRFYDKRGDFKFPIVKFPFLSSNIPSAPAYAVYVSHHVRLARACCKYEHFAVRGKLLFLLSSKLLS